MRTSAVPKEQRPSFCAQCLVIKLLEVVSFLVLKLVKVFCLLLLLLTEHSGVPKEILVGGMTTILYKQCTCTYTKERKLCCYAAGMNYYTEVGCVRGPGRGGGEGLEGQSSLKGAVRMTHLSHVYTQQQPLSCARFKCTRFGCNMWPHPLPPPFILAQA